jgi:hypothetical protein
MTQIAVQRYEALFASDPRTFSILPHCSTPLSKMAPTRFPCQECNRTLKTKEGLDQHRQALHCWACPVCTEKFVGKKLLEAHQRSAKHCCCGTCTRVFSHDQALADHRAAVHTKQSPVHSGLFSNQQKTIQFHCCDCNRDFSSESALRQHLANKNHALPARLNRVCERCGRQFINEKALSQHLSSLAHIPLCNVGCIGHQKCKRRFRCPSGLLHHLESGTCCSGINRLTLNNVVCKRDTGRVITCDSIPAKPNLPAIDACPATTETLRGTEKRLSSIRAKIRCPLCPTHKGFFHTPSALRDHLASPVHAPKQFRCPSSLLATTELSGIQKHFSTLSGLTQHLESGACQGGQATFREAVTYVEERLKHMGLKDWRLLN